MRVELLKKFQIPTLNSKNGVWWLADTVLVWAVQEFSKLFGVLQGGTEQKTSRRREFEAWLSKQNDLLSRILSTKGATLRAKELKIRQDTLKVSFC